MKKFRGLSVLCACVLALGQSAFTVNAAETNQEPVSVSETGEPLYRVIYKLDGGTGRIDESDPVAKNETTKLSVWALRKDGYSHTGWTDGEKTYGRGSRLKMPDHDVVLYPVWSKVFKIEYEKLEPYGYSSSFADGTVAPGTVINLPNYAMHYGDAMFNGWLVNGKHYDPLSSFEMPEENVYVAVDWLEPIQFRYWAGDVDGVIGTDEYVVGKFPGSNMNLSDSTRLARLGYKLTGWYYAEEGKRYDPEDPFVVPMTDTTILAEWTPIKVSVSYRANGGTGTMDKHIEVYDTFVKIHDCEFVKEGYKLLGWKFKDKYYRPGEEFRLKIDSIGESIKFDAVWIEEDKNPGDINNDSIVDLTDLSLLSMNLLNEYEFADEEQAERADVNCDGELDITDLSRFKQYISHEKILLGMKGE